MAQFEPKVLIHGNFQQVFGSNAKIYFGSKVSLCQVLQDSIQTPILDNLWLSNK
jgi:hypothetical protein